VERARYPSFRRNLPWTKRRLRRRAFILAPHRSASALCYQILKRGHRRLRFERSTQLLTTAALSNST